MRGGLGLISTMILSPPLKRTIYGVVHLAPKISRPQITNKTYGLQPFLVSPKVSQKLQESPLSMLHSMLTWLEKRLNTMKKCRMHEIRS